MAIKIISDSTSDILKENQKALDVKIIPLKVYFGEECFLDGVTISHEEFYEKLTQSEALPTTSQITPDTFEKEFREVLDGGDEAIAILMCSDLSGTYNSANIAKQAIGDSRVHIIDSRHVTFPLGMLVAHACHMRDAGASAEEIVNEIEAIKGKVKFAALIDTLEYLKKGGRLSGITASIGTALNIKPILDIIDGNLSVKTVVRGQKKVMIYLADFIRQGKFKRHSLVGFGNTNAQEAMRKLMETVSDVVDINQCYSSNIGAIVGTHAGPGCVGVCYVEE